MQKGSVSAIEKVIQKGHLPAAGTQTFEQPRLRQMFTPDLPAIEVNCIWKSLLAAKTLARDVATLCEPYRENRLPMGWLIGPGSKPKGLADELLKQGFHLAFVGVAMTFETSRWSTIERSPGVRVQAARVDNIDQYWQVLEKRVTPDLIRWSAQVFRGELGDVKLFIATIDDEPVGIAASHVMGEQAFLMNAFTHPRHRKKGVYRELLRYRLKSLHERGVKTAVTLAKENTSAPLCAKYGFTEVARFSMFQIDFRN